MKKIARTRYNPLPCPKCGSHERYIKSGNCPQCQRSYVRIECTVFKINEREPLLMQSVHYDDAEGRLM